MNIRELLKNEQLITIFSEVETFTNNLVSKYNDKLRYQSIPKDGKEVFDAVWGTIEFNPAEISILDSPLLQRLRKIKQLGLASYVYCGADYSRFCHTLGVVFLADKMASKIRRKADNFIDKDKFKHNPIQIVRLAAIFHDVGHMFLSHASEYYYASEVLPSRSREIKKALTMFRRETSSKASLHEMLSVFIVNTKEVRTLLLKVCKYFDEIKIIEDDDIDKIIEYISCLIIGVASDRFILPYSQIINGPIDADKCDYLSRDSHVTKVPVAVDVFRLIQKLRVVEVDSIDFPNIWDDSSYGKGKYYKMALMHSAQKALGQLLIARAIMFESIYCHQKVVIAETMFRDVIRYFDHIGCTEFRDFSRILGLTDEALSDYLPSIISLTEEQKMLSDTKNIIRLLKQINRRELYKRVACITTDTLDGENMPINDFLRDIIEHPIGEQRRNFIQSVIDEYKKIKYLQGIDVDNEISEVSIVEFPKQTIDTNKIEMPIDFGDGEIKMSKEVFQSETWIQSRDIRKKEHYLVTNLYDRETVYLALEKVLYIKYKLRLTSDSYVCAKFEKEQINKQKNILFEKGYYNDATILLTDDIIYSMINKNLLQQVAEMYRTFEGIGGARITEKSIVNFMRQILYYTTDRNTLKTLFDGILRLLNKATYIDRSYFNQHVESLFNQILKERDNDIYICRLGGALDSSAHLWYFFNDLKPIREKAKLNEDLSEILCCIEDTSCITFFDDGAYSGNQVISIFQEFMGVPLEKRATKEHHVDELSGDLKIKLKKQQIIIAYICFNQESEKYISDKLAEIGLTNVSIKYDTGMNTKAFESETFANEEQSRLVRECLHEIGMEILYSKKTNNGVLKPAWNDERIKSSSLGYNDAQQMIILKSSVPTYTITPFWENGIYKGNVWNQLFPRTLKD